MKGLKLQRGGGRGREEMGTGGATATMVVAAVSMSPELSLISPCSPHVYMSVYLPASLCIYVDTCQLI